jgi:hypothetical protein
MSFNFNRTNNKITKKSVTINNVINSNNLKESIGSTGIATIANINTLRLNGSTVTVSANQINKTQINSTGTAEASKLLILDNNRNISNINSLSCSTLIVNGQNITSNTFQISSSNDINNQYLTNITAGIGSSSKALVFDNKKKLSNINSLSVENLTINNVNIKNLYNVSKPLLFKNFEELNPNIHSLNTNYLSNTFFKRMSAQGSNAAILNNYYWPSVCYSSELQLFVAVSNGGSDTPTTDRVVTSKDGQNWIVQTAIDNNWEDIIWINKLRLFVAVSSNGVNNQIMTSYNGINWTSQITPTSNYAFYSLAWSDELNLCVAVNTSNNAIMISNDCINWKLVYSNGTKPMNKVCWSPELSLFIATTTLVSSYCNIIVSTDGTNWTQQTNSPFSSNISLNSISWSPYLKMFIIASSGPANQQVYYSYDGYKWNTGFCTLNMMTTIWIDELKLFLGYNDGGIMSYSRNGINWTNYTVDTSGSFSSKPGKICWSPELSIILSTMRQGWTGSINGERFHIFQPQVLGKNPLFLKNNAYFYYDQNNKKFGFNTLQPNRPIEINSNNGNVLKLSYPHNNDNIFTTFNLTNNGQLNLNTNTINISTNYISNGLKLNNTLIQTNITLLNNLSSLTEGIAKPLLPLQVNSSNNITNINNIMCNSLIVNNNNLDTNNNNIYFQNNIIGSASNSKALITDINNNIKNINNITLNQINVNNSNINTKQLNNITDYNLTSINNTINNKNIEIYDKLFTNYSNANVSVANWSSLIWVSELQLYIAVSVANVSNSNRIMTSPNGKIWTENTIIQGYNFQSVVWSSELQLLVAVNNNVANYRILTSTDGLNWNPQFNSSIDYSWISMIYSSELNLFVAISNDSSTAGRIMVSNTGYNWVLVNNNTVFSYQSIIWAENLNLFIITTTSVTSPIYISKDGYNWTSSNININNVSSTFKDITWSKELNMLMLLTSSENTLFYSYDGYIWHSLYITFSTSSTRKIYWISELKLFLILPNNNYFYYSNNGLDWYQLSVYISHRIDTLAWSPDLKNLVILTYSSSHGFSYVFSSFFPNNSLNTVVSQTNNLIINKTNGYIGLGTNPSYQLELSTDSAAKASSSTWTISSDIRLKENIEDADLDLCYNNFKQINLVKYKWKNNIYSNDQINDRTQLGWIAQDIEQIFPKSVITKNKFDIIDCKFLNSDQLLSTLYGTVKKLINNFELQENKIDEFDTELNNIDNFLKSLEISS